jgi:hypothetical protein
MSSGFQQTTDGGEVPHEQVVAEGRRFAKASAGDAQRDPTTGTWLVPISDSWLDLLSGDWSEPVQLRAVRSDRDGRYVVKVREARAKAG